MPDKRKLLLGVFVIGGILLFCVGLFLIGSRKQLFEHHFTVYTYAANMSTLQTGAIVRVAGMNTGQVKAIQVPNNPSAKFRLTLEVDEKFHPMVREDSVTSIETEGMVGTKYLEIAQGTSKSPECPAGFTRRSQQANGMDQLMEKGSEIEDDVQATIKDLHKNADQALQSFTATANHVDGMVVAVRENVEQIASNAARVSADAQQIAAGVKRGQGVAGELLSDPALAANVRTTIDNAKQTSANAEQASNNANAMITDFKQKTLPAVDQAASNVSDMTGQLDKATGTFLAKGNSDVATAIALRNTVQGAQQAVTNVSDDTEALKHNFFFRGFFHRRGFFNLPELTPEKYAPSKFVRKARARVWIPAAGLFFRDSDGTQKLTETGPQILDQFMSDLVPFLPNNPLVIEGYADGAIPGDSYVEARERAVDVRQYLGESFSP